MMANMACSLFKHKRITTTVPKAKALRKYVEPLITKAKNDTTNNRRVVFSYLKDKHAVSELFNEGITKVGDRPCMGEVDPAKQKALVDRGVAVLDRFRGPGVIFGSSSTDCNIPLSMGIPAIAMGCIYGKGAHTREEYAEIDSIPGGLKIAAEMILHEF